MLDLGTHYTIRPAPTSVNLKRSSEACLRQGHGRSDLGLPED
jgi:hypothetical protein